MIYSDIIYLFIFFWNINFENRYLLSVFHLSFCPSNHPPTCLSICLPFCLPTYLFKYMWWARPNHFQWTCRMLTACFCVTCISTLRVKCQLLTLFQTILHSDMYSWIDCRVLLHACHHYFCLLDTHFHCWCVRTYTYHHIYK